MAVFAAVAPSAKAIVVALNIRIDSVVLVQAGCRLVSANVAVGAGGRADAPYRGGRPSVT